ncbi:MAG TPA: DUF4129 domain-containing protein [Mycobacterium sp.]|jgi:hypothetical protein|nr:DUF4129 domain-containing protein [Mycobacterium sp.]
MPGIDKPTRRVVALIVLLIVVAAALRGYLPAHERAAHTEPGSNRAALIFVVAALSGTLALVAVAVIARLRDPRAIAPNTRDLSEMLGTGRGRPNWRVLLIGLGVIVAWLLIAMLVSRVVPHAVTSSPRPPDTSAPPAHVNTQPPPQQHPQNNNGDMFPILLATTVPMLLIIVTGTAIMSRRQWKASIPRTVVDDYIESAPPPKTSESLVRAAELGLAEIGDLNREPREAIIACYAAMERELANVPGAAPQDFDTPTEVLVRAVEHQALHVDNAVELVKLFEEARFSPHVMNESHREVAVQVLRLVLAELRSPV